MATIKELVGRNVGLRKTEFERKIKESGQTKPLIDKFEKRRMEESIKPVSIPGIFSHKPKSEVFISRLKAFEKNHSVKKMSKTRFQLFQDPAQILPVETAKKSFIPEAFKRKNK